MNIFDLVDPEFNGAMSSDEIWYAGESNICLTDVIDAKSDYDHTHSGYAALNHSHSGYASADDLATLEDVVDTKADASHTHDGYALSNHEHDGYATQVALDTLGDEVDGKADANHVHTEYAPSSHSHDEYALTAHSHSEYASQSDLDLLEDVVDTKADSTHTHSEYALTSHVHNDYVLQTDFDALESEVDGKASASHTHDYAPSSHTHNEYSEIGHNHDNDYAPVDHSHSSYATTTALDELSVTVSGKANVSHNHDDVYYTETEIDTLLAGKASSSHTHTGVYDASGAAASALTSANAYTDSKIDALVGEGASTTLDTIGEISSAIEDNQDAIDLLNSAIGSKANATDLTSHANDTDIHITSAERTAWNAKSNFSGNYNDLTNKPTIPSINGLATETYVDEKVAAVTVESIGALPDTTVIPTVPTNVSAFTNDAGYLTEHQSLAGLATETYVDTQIDAIDIPSALSDLTADSTHRLVTDAEKATWNAKSDFSGNYNDLTNKPSIPSISGLATETYVDEAVSAKANSSHSHAISDVTGLQSALDSKAASDHNHNASYDVKGAANTALASAKDYTDDAIADEVTARNSAIATAKSSAISTAASDATTKANNALSSAKTYADSVGVAVKNDLLGNAGAAYDTLKELGDLIDDNTDAIDALEVVASGKANAVHTHAISDVSGLQSALDGKAASSHGTHVTYSTTAPVMDGTASVGTASTVARSDHKHPVDTSRAAQTDLDALETVVAGKANSSHTHTIANVTNLQSSLDAKQATITGGASTIASANLTSSRALVSDSSGKVAVSAVTSTELGYLDGVTSNVQTQLNGKAASSHTHSAATASAAGFMSASDKSKLDGITASADSVSFSRSLTSGTKVGTITINGTGTDLYAPTNTDTHYTTGLKVGASASATANAAASNGSVYLNVLDNTTVRDSHKIVGSGATTVTSDANGVITISSTDTNTTYSAATTSANGLMTSAMVTKLNGIATGANAYTLPSAGSSLGGVKSGGDVTISSGVITVNDDSHNHIISNVDGLQSALDGKASSLHTHSYAGSSSAGGAATSANKLATARTISLTGDVTGSTSFDGSGNVSITATVADDSHNHIISNIDGLQSALDGKSASSHTHTAQSLVSMANALFATSYNGGVEFSYGADSGKNVLTEISNMEAGLHTIYSIAGTTGNPKTTESWRMLVHKTSVTIGWVLAFDASGSIYSNYQSAAGTFKGWRCIYDVEPPILWMGEYWITDTQTVTPSKALSECRNGWVLVWSDYDTENEKATNGDCFTTVIPKWNPNHVKWSGQSFIAAVPTNLASDGTIAFCGKRMYVHDTKITGHTVNDVSPANDVCLRAIYEF